MLNIRSDGWIIQVVLLVVALLPLMLYGECKLVTLLHQLYNSIIPT